jgi:hypothetical protein
MDSQPKAQVQEGKWFPTLLFCFGGAFLVLLAALVIMSILISNPDSSEVNAEGRCWLARHSASAYQVAQSAVSQPRSPHNRVTRLQA